MDWFSWLSKTNLDPILVYEYSAILAHNELEENDLPYFDHEFLQSMGISIAKHRLEILKLAKKIKVKKFPLPLSKILTAIRQTKKLVSKYVRKWAHSHESTLALVPKHNHSEILWQSDMVKRSKRVQVVRPRLLITNGSPYKAPSSPKKIDVFLDPFLDKIDHEGDGGAQNEFLSSTDEETRWDKMFDNLNPT
ncbi:uncharacterized protein LOC127254401 [Andrographis paniculata]|uniref:uncharacterized protein LOC127254401 n=1 Tax=Andrographis paniculata TaxID=175694 RepID=UPI0021E867CD|nr:uncharacterized protein LOC127254401 [Andrographis paniculata]